MLDIIRLNDFDLGFFLVPNVRCMYGGVGSSEYCCIVCCRCKGSGYWTMGVYGCVAYASRAVVVVGMLGMI